MMDVHTLGLKIIFSPESSLVLLIWGGKKHPCNSLFNDLKDKIPIFICFFNLPAKETHSCYIRFFISMPKVSVLDIN